MPLLFSYGTLQQASVQRATFGRLLRGERDVLPGFESSLVRIQDRRAVEASGQTHYANVIFNGRDDCGVPGMVFEVSDEELAAADEYERSASYKRISAVLRSGKQAWLYVDSPALRSSPRR
jgi:hypothetical protein